MKRFPWWLKKRLFSSDTANQLEDIIDKLGLYTVCKSSCCPNQSECFSRKKVTFMILGNICTRDCRFCSVKKGSPLPLDMLESEKLSKAVGALGLRQVIITSVTRDDLVDGGAGQFHDVVYQIKNSYPGVTIEVLTPDFKGVPEESMDKLLDSPIDIFSHNIETVPRLYNIVRPMADYKRSLGVLRKAKRKIKITKSGIMVGLGETRYEVFRVIEDLREVGCELLTIGQYLQPTTRQIDVYEFIHPKVFNLYQDEAMSMGFKYVLSNPFARTSYMSNVVN